MTHIPDAAAMDGNVAAGALAELFVAEITSALTTCGTCGDTRPLGELAAYAPAVGLVLRCTTCDAVQLRLVRSAQRAWLDVQGIRVLQFELPPS